VFVVLRTSPCTRINQRDADRVPQVQDEGGASISIVLSHRMDISASELAQS
jgi:hypothetical protein